MFEFDPIIASYILAALSVVSTPILEFIKAHKERRFRKTDLFYKYKYSAYKDFLDAYSRTRVMYNSEYYAQFLSSLHVAASVSDKKLQEKLLAVLKECPKETANLSVDISDDIDECVKLISAEYRKYTSKF